ncbi:MAG: 3-methyl-2-oxobutanoate hydroxymethyltransferase [Gammaproteobacteria bacterium]|jgi:3-methyl-2-oxobutanoate hydroxymethyltransferase|nr:3-methyl-2-oxobutanoate hydroxymethyltransferase [Gammaproteobacteria bacterium]
MNAQSLPPVTLITLRDMKRTGEKFACLTAYDASFARLIDDAGVEVILVGDSLGMVVQGRETTLPVTVEDIIYHSSCVARGRSRALLMVDMPFMSYATPEQALRNAARLMQEGGAHIVKLEGGAVQADIVRQLTERGIPVCAHLGLQPQSVHKLGGYRVQGREASAAQVMRDDARALQAAGADMLLLECVPAALAAEITLASEIPVIGIGAGPGCDAQVLVLYDMLGITLGKRPKFSKNFMQDNFTPQAAIAAYVQAVKHGAFPAPEHTFN